MPPVRQLLARYAELIPTLGAQALGRPMRGTHLSGKEKVMYLILLIILIILLIGLLVANTYYWRRIALLALGRADFPAKVNLVLAILKVGGILLLVPRYGFLASAALLSGFYILGSIISVWKIHNLVANENIHV